MSGLKMKYFVLKPAGDNIYSEASRAAMKEYARVIIDENPNLANDLLKWVSNEFGAHFDRTTNTKLPDAYDGRR